jgi:hypothetical protein
MDDERISKYDWLAFGIARVGDELKAGGLPLRLRRGSAARSRSRRA